MLCGISVRVLYSYTVKKTPRFKKISKNMMCFMGTPPNSYMPKNTQIYLKGLGTYDGICKMLRCFSTFDCESLISWSK